MRNRSSDGDSEGPFAVLSSPVRIRSICRDSEERMPSAEHIGRYVSIQSEGPEMRGGCLLRTSGGFPTLLSKRRVPIGYGQNGPSPVGGRRPAGICILRSGRRKCAGGKLPGTGAAESGSPGERAFEDRGSEFGGSTAGNCRTGGRIVPLRIGLQEGRFKHIGGGFGGTGTVLNARRFLWPVRRRPFAFSIAWAGK